MNDITKIKKILANHEKRIKNLERKSTSSASKESTKTTIGNLIENLKKRGFFKNPRSRDEIVKKLAQDGYRYNPDSLNSTLQKIVQKKILGRIGENRNWRYVNR